MKITWLNAEFTEAKLTRGYLWWKRVAIVKRSAKGAIARVSGVLFEDYDYTFNWYYPSSGSWCDLDLDYELDTLRREERAWMKPARLIGGAK